jgi:hypothetical protein
MMTTAPDWADAISGSMIPNSMTMPARLTRIRLECAANRFMLAKAFMLVLKYVRAQILRAPLLTKLVRKFISRGNSFVHEGTKKQFRGETEGR